MKTAILVDGSYFLKRYRVVYKNWRNKSVEQVIRDMRGGLLRDLRKANPKIYTVKRDLYRIFFYDCPPINSRAQNPISKKHIDFSTTSTAKFRTDLHTGLKKERKLALRLGRIADEATWAISKKKTKALLNGKITVDDLTENDVNYEIRQKGVDMRIGLDIASLSYNKNVDQIILIAGDSDFVPAAKLARRQGLDFILDPMWNHINPDLHEHIDGLFSCWPKPI